MRPSRFTEAQIVEALREVQDGASAVQVCRALGITETTFYRWRKKHALPDGEDSTLIRALQQENHELREIVANLMLEHQRALSARDKR